MEQELLKNNFERHGFKTSFFDTKEAALDYLKDQISGKKVAIGGSVTAQEMGLYEALSKKNEVIWHWKKASRPMILQFGGSVHNQRQWCFQNRRTGQYRWNRKPRVADLIRTGKSIFCHWKQ